jgi:hypothetical protein
LDEVVYQGISNDMAVPIQALDHFRKQAQRAFEFSPELEIRRTAGKGPAIEVDICCLMDGSLIVGEAKTGPLLDKARKQLLLLGLGCAPALLAISIQETLPPDQCACAEPPTEMALGPPGARRSVNPPERATLKI